MNYKSRRKELYFTHSGQTDNTTTQRSSGTFKIIVSAEPVLEDGASQLQIEPSFIQQVFSSTDRELGTGVHADTMNEALTCPLAIPHSPHCEIQH